MKNAGLAYTIGATIIGGYVTYDTLKKLKDPTHTTTIEKGVNAITKILDKRSAVLSDDFDMFSGREPLPDYVKELIRKEG